jgi:hypothetical protein
MIDPANGATNVPSTIGRILITSDVLLIQNGGLLASMTLTPSDGSPPVISTTQLQLPVGPVTFGPPTGFVVPNLKPQVTYGVFITEVFPPTTVFCKQTITISLGTFTTGT